MPLLEEAQKAARLLREQAYVRVLAREDGDACCAAVVLGQALRREGIDFHVSWTPRLTAELSAAVSEESNEALVLLGLGGDADAPGPAASRRVAVDRDARGLDADARLTGDAQAASLGALTHVLAVALSPRNEDLAPLALAGALASRAHVGGFRGLDAALLEDAQRSGLLTRDVGLALRGSTLLAALSSLDDPAVNGLTGRARNVKKLTSDLGLGSDAPPSSLAPSDAERLGSVLTLRLLQQGAGDAALDALLRPRIRAQRGPHTGIDAADLAWLAESGAALGRGGLAFAALWPDEAAMDELTEAATALREELVAALLKAERDARREGRLHLVDAPRAALAAPLADRVALTLPEGVAVARCEDALAIRAFGRDVADAARKAAEACGGRAWGAGGAARVRVPDEPRFLKLLEEAL